MAQASKVSLTHKFYYSIKLGGEGSNTQGKIDIEYFQNKAFPKSVINTATLLCKQALNELLKLLTLASMTFIKMF